MADEDITLDGKPLHSLRVADLKDALQQRKLPKSGQKNALIKRLKGALMLENLQKSSASHSGLQPNSQIGEEMSQNSFIKQYLATQQELLLQKLEREAAQATETDESSATEEKEEPCDRTEDSSFVADMCLSGAPQPLIGRPAPEGLRGQQAAPEGPGAWPLWSSRPQREASPPRAVASLSVRVLGQPDLQGLPPAAPQRAPDKEGVAPVEPGSAHPAHHLSRSAAAAAPSRDDSEDEDSEEESEEEEEWGGVPARSGRAPAQLRPPQQQQPAPPAAPPRSRRKLQPPQHIPPPQQAHPPPMQLRHPTPPPSPPPELSFPLPDTPKQSPPNAEEEAGGSGGESPGAPGGRRPAPQRQDSDDSDDSDSSAGSSSPEHAQRRGAGPLARLVLKMDTEKGAEPEAVDMSVGGARRSSAASSSTAAPTQQPLIPGRAEKKEMRPQEDEKKKRPQEEEKMRPQEEEKRTPQEKKEATGVQSTAQMGPGDESDGRAAAESDRRLPPWKRGRTAAQVSRPPGRGGGEAGPNTDPPARRDAAPLRASAGTPSLALKRPQMVPQLSPAPPRGAVVVTLRDSGSSCDSDSGADSSRSSSSSKEKPRSARIVKSAGHGRKADEERKTDPERVEAPTHQAVEREVSETSKAPAKEAEPHTPSAAANEPAPEAKPANGSGLEESNTPKVFTARKISLSSSKTSPPAGVDGAMGAAAESEAGAAAAGRKRRWGSSAGVTAKKPSISITTDSLKSLIPDIKVSQEAVVDLHPAELQLSGGEEEEEEEEEEREGRRGVDNGRADRDLGLKIRRTVTQVVPGNGQENGQGEEQHPMEEGEGEEEEAAAQEEDKQWRLEKEQQHKAPKERRRSSTRGGDDNGGVAGATHRSPAQQEAEAQKVTPSDSVVRRSISQQKSGMSVTIDDAAGPAAPRQPSPPRGKLSAIVHVTNLVRPFTLGQLKELLKRTGSLLEEGFWIDKIKSHCFVTYATTDEAQATRTALHGLKWPPSNPKVLSVDYSQQDELDFHRGTLKVERPPERSAPPPAPRLPPLMPERDRGGMERDKGRERGGVPMREQWAERGQMGVVLRDPWGAGRRGPPGDGGGGVRDQWAEREREMQRREQARCEREWDRDKIREFGQPGEEPRRSRSRDRERRRRDQAKSKERKADKKDEPPAKLLDDLFLKTTAAPCIYWLPLTEEQVKKRREQDQEESRKKEEERKERLKAREAGGLAAGGGGGGGAVGGGGAGGRGGGGRAVSGARRPDAPQERDGDRKRDGFRSRGPSGGGGLLGGGGDGGGGGGRHSRSRSNPRVRRR